MVDPTPSTTPSWRARPPSVRQFPDLRSSTGHRRARRCRRTGGHTGRLSRSKNFARQSGSCQNGIWSVAMCSGRCRARARAPRRGAAESARSPSSPPSSSRSTSGRRRRSRASSRARLERRREYRCETPSRRVTGRPSRDTTEVELRPELEPVGRPQRRSQPTPPEQRRASSPRPGDRPRPVRRRTRLGRSMVESSSAQRRPNQTAGRVKSRALPRVEEEEERIVDDRRAALGQAGSRSR